MVIGDCRYPHVADCASLIVNMGLLRLQPLAVVSARRGYMASGNNSRPLRTLFMGGCIVSVGYAIALQRLNPVGILPPGSRPSDVHFDIGIYAAVDAMACEACEAETQARHVARGKRSATPGIRHPTISASV